VVGGGGTAESLPNVLINDIVDTSQKVAGRRISVKE